MDLFGRNVGGKLAALNRSSVLTNVDCADQTSAGQRAPDGSHHCCGVLALAGLPPPIDMSVTDQICMSLVSALPEDNHAACGPARLDRPPRHQPLI